MDRIAENYNPIVHPSHVILMSFRRQTDAIAYNFAAWESKEKFETNAPPIAEHSVNFTIEGESAFGSFMNDNSTLIEAIDQRVSEIVELDLIEYDLTNYVIDGWSRTITANGTPKQGSIIATKTISDFGNLFDATMQDNQNRVLLQQIGFVLLQNAAVRNSYYMRVLNFVLAQSQTQGGE